MVGFKVGYFWYQIGNGDFLYSFFSTIAVNLENGKWGSVFPIVMNELYQGKVDSKHIEIAQREVREIRTRLSSFSSDNVIWDYESTEKQPPWGTNISTDITDLSNYFVTSDGEDLFEVLDRAIMESKESGHPLMIEAI